MTTSKRQYHCIECELVAKNDSFRSDSEVVTEDLVQNDDEMSTEDFVAWSQEEDEAEADNDSRECTNS